MNALSISTPSHTPHNLTAPLAGFQRPAPSGDQVADAEATREAFTQFVGASLFGQMLSSMRKTVGEPAYFHGGQAEKMFQGQLDNAIADEMTDAGASTFAQSLFERQFPRQAETLRLAEAAADTTQGSPLDQLNTLPRR